MSGEIKKESIRKEIILTIKLPLEGGITVEGPGNGKMFDEPMCYYLLKKADRFIEAHNARATAPKIQPAKGGIMNFVRGKK